MTASAYLAAQPFAPDRFQIEAADVLERGRSLVVTAPTGSGKTLVADTAIHLARTSGKRAFYTTPIKALSNQKYADLGAEHGAEQVGLLTGDNVINGDAPIVVMTTEVLRNMIYADAAGLGEVGVVVLDEVHYLQDPFRGAVWEEIIIHAPTHMQFVCLSATVANAEEFVGWIRSRRGPTDLIVAKDRPVPLESLYMVADRTGPERLKMLPMFEGSDGRRRPNPKLERLLSLERGGRRRFVTPRRLEVVEALAEAEMLPAIYFIFSRAGCDAAAVSMLESGVRFLGADERERVRREAEVRTAHLGDRDLDALGYGRWLAAMESGVAAHHAGMVPAFKETVEELFRAGLLRVVFATETLALGINMPARTVVLEALSKFTGEGHALLEPGDYTQLTGRAGRRGIDTRGHGVVLHSRFVPLQQVLRIAETGSHPLRSSFRPSYNMAANLVANYPSEVAEELLTASFAQFQRVGSQVETEHRLTELQARLDLELARSECERGSVAEYTAAIDRGRSGGGKGMAGALHPGDVVDVFEGPRAGRYVVLKRLARGKKGVRLLVMGTGGRTSALSDGELAKGSVKAATVDLPGPYRGPKDRKYLEQVRRALRKLPPSESPTPEAVRLDHPVAECPDAAAHVAAYRRAVRTERRIEQLRSHLRTSGVGVVEDFHAIEAILEKWGYLAGWSLTPTGEQLRFVYNELDLLLTECITRGAFTDLNAAELAALASCFVYEPRTEHAGSPAWSTAELEHRFGMVMAAWAELTEMERAHRLTPSRAPEPGFAAAAYEWALQRELDDLPTASMSPGDFVRVSRQLVDLLRQLRDTFPDLAGTARAGLAAIDRGVVAAQGVG